MFLVLVLLYRRDTDPLAERGDFCCYVGLFLNYNFSKRFNSNLRFFMRCLICSVVGNNSVIILNRL